MKQPSLGSLARSRWYPGSEEATSTPRDDLSHWGAGDLDLTVTLFLDGHLGLIGQVPILLSHPARDFRVSLERLPNYSGFEKDMLADQLACGHEPIDAVPVVRRLAALAARP